MALITADEIVRGLSIGVFGGVAGVCTLAFPGSPLWLVPAGLAVGGCALTVPEVRDEVRRALPMLAQARPLLDAPRALGRWVKTGELPPALWSLPGVSAPATAQRDGTATTRRRPVAGTLPDAELFRAVNDRPDDNPHLTVVGPSGSGKTTFVSAVLGRRPGRVVVLTPKVSPGAWRGAEVVTLSDDLSYEPLADTLGALQLEAKRRAVALKRGEPLEPMTVVLDELPELVAEVPAAGPFAVRLSRWGRELGMRQVVLATSDDALNIKGWAATRPNYARVELGKPDDAGQRLGWLDDGQSRRRLDLGGLRERAERATLRPWREAAPATGTTTIARAAVAAEGARPRVVSERVSPPAPADDLLASLLAVPVTSASGRPGNASGVTVTVPSAGGNGNGNTSASATVTSASGSPGNAVVRIYAQAVAGGRAHGRQRRGLDMRARRARAHEQRQNVELHRAYAAARADGVPSFRQAYAQIGGNREQALAAWQAAQVKEP
jgi:hypothetical protein